HRGDRRVADHGSEPRKDLRREHGRPVAASRLMKSNRRTRRARSVLEEGCSGAALRHTTCCRGATMTRAFASFRIVSIVTALAAPAPVNAQSTSFTVTVVPSAHGTVTLTPPLPPDGHYAAGTVVTLTTAPDAGYVLDSAWYSVAGRFGQMYHEGMGREFKVTI